MKLRNIAISILFLTPLFGSAQFFKGFGLMGGLTLSSQKWLETAYDGSNTVLTKTKHKLLWGFNGELFAEFINHDNVRWRTEFEYDRKGTKHRETKDKNRLDYISWNNYLVLRGEVFSGHPYFLIGPRFEYAFIQKTPSVPFAFRPLHFSWSAGVGFEFITFGAMKPLVEVHYNPDLNKAMMETYSDGVSGWGIRNRAWELRVGVIFRFNDNSCPPVFK